MELLRGFGELVRYGMAKLLHRIARNSFIINQIWFYTTLPTVTLEYQTLKPAFLPPPLRRVSFGKAEAEMVALMFLEYSLEDPTRYMSLVTRKETPRWHKVPWPGLALRYHKSIGQLLWSMSCDGNFFNLIRNLKALPRVPKKPGEGAVFTSHPNGEFYEETRSNGIANFLLIGIWFLIERDYVDLLPGKDDRPDMLAPTQKLIDAFGPSRVRLVA